MHPQGTDIKWFENLFDFYFVAFVESAAELRTEK